MAEKTAHREIDELEAKLLERAKPLVRKSRRRGKSEESPSKGQDQKS